jgi:hypothetical protein
MQIFTIIGLLLLATLAVACPPPLNNIHFLANHTHTSWEIIQNTFAQQGHGSVGKKTELQCASEMRTDK